MKEKEYGNIAEGNVANMILIDGNPVENISDIRKIDITFKNGKAYNAKKILNAYGWK